MAKLDLELSLEQASLEISLAGLPVF